MRIVHVVVASALAAAMLTAPALARSSQVQKNEDKSAASSGCSAYQQAADGSWEQLPCKEAAEHGQAQTQHRAPAQGTDHEER